MVACQSQKSSTISEGEIRHNFLNQIITQTYWHFEKINRRRTLWKLPFIARRWVFRVGGLLSQTSSYSNQSDPNVSGLLKSFIWQTQLFHQNLSSILPRTWHNEDSYVLIIVKDLKIGPTKLAKTEQTISHYETMFSNNSVDLNHITVIPLSKLLNDYAGYEQRRQLSYMYEQFIVDKDIAVKVNAFLGTRFHLQGKAAFPIDLTDQETLADKVDEILCMVYCMYTQPMEHQEPRTMIRVGRHSMTTADIVENIIDLLYQLQDVHPGNFYKNILCRFLFTNC